MTPRQKRIRDAAIVLLVAAVLVVVVMRLPNPCGPDASPQYYMDNCAERPSR